ncbi:phosphatidate cytidylyltransferase [Prochlorococcus sp. MIT 1223]|uniref:phosphatidate cytidylyltransferase n=1 Tax=Prochlorococcus sp. MIT 1223 TaxID=3096217 RepID=UPI002A75E633|nr:phosphatidate cytidylyltransferase [Prochlorococcus sp. MIT 1223]
MLKRFLNKRFSSGLAAGGFGLIVVTLGGWWFAVSLGVIVHLALLEFFRMAEFTGIRPATKTTLVACQLLLLTTQLGIDGVVSDSLTLAVLPLSGAAICGWLLLQPKTGSIADIASSIFGLFYLGYLPSHWLKLRNINDITLFNSLNQYLISPSQVINVGMSITLSVCFMIVAFDIGSYFLGRNYGKTSLSPISPSKTIEGAIGGLFCSILIGALSIKYLNLPIPTLVSCLLGLLVSLFALVGDLTESMMKRDAGLKDSGNILPGHGGILDRIDSYLFTPAVIYYVLTLIGKL